MTGFDKIKVKIFILDKNNTNIVSRLKMLDETIFELTKGFVK